MAELQLLAWWQTPFSILPSEIVKRIMLWIAVDDVVDFFPTILTGPKHITLPIMLTSKQFYRELSELIYEKQEVINIVVDGSKRDEHRPRRFRAFQSLGKRLIATPWHTFKTVRFHLQPGLVVALSELAASSRPTCGQICEKNRAVEELGLCKDIMLGAFDAFCVILNGRYCAPPMLKGPTKVEIVFYEVDGTYAATAPSLTPVGLVRHPPAPFWTPGDVASILACACRLRDPESEPEPIQCLCKGSMHDHSMPWRNDPKLELGFYLPNLACVLQTNHSALDESEAPRNCSQLLGRLRNLRVMDPDCFRE